MKQSYIRPTASVIKLATEEAFLTGSLTGDGSDNVSIKPSDEEYNGSFQSESRGWNSDNWE